MKTKLASCASCHCAVCPSAGCERGKRLPGSVWFTSLWVSASHPRASSAHHWFVSPSPSPTNTGVVLCCLLLFCCCFVFFGVVCQGTVLFVTVCPHRSPVPAHACCSTAWPQQPWFIWQFWQMKMEEVSMSSLDNSKLEVQQSEHTHTQSHCWTLCTAHLQNVLLVWLVLCCVHLVPPARALLRTSCLTWWRMHAWVFALRYIGPSSRAIFSWMTRTKKAWGTLVSTKPEITYVFSYLRFLYT